MREQRKSFTSFVILSIGAVVFLLVAAGCQNAGNEKLPDGARRPLDENIGTGRYRIVSAEKASNPQARYEAQELWCVVLNGPHEVQEFGHPTLEYGDIVDGNYPVLVHRIGNYWAHNPYAPVPGVEYAGRNEWLRVGCRENTYTDPY